MSNLLVAQRIFESKIKYHLPSLPSLQYGIHVVFDGDLRRKQPIFLAHWRTRGIIMGLGARQISTVGADIPLIDISRCAGAKHSRLSVLFDNYVDLWTPLEDQVMFD